MSIGVVIFNYNRWPNLRLALRALQEQTLPLSEFHVVVADDGSTDGTIDEMRHLMRSPEWQGRLHLISAGPHHGARISRIDNIGIANLPPECSLAVIVDGDICLAPDALEQIKHLHVLHPDAVIITRLDWLRPMTHAEIEAIWDEEGFDSLYNCVPNQPMHWLQETLVGLENRPLPETAQLEPLNTAIFHQVYALPVEIFWRIGGYDEEMAGYGFQQLEFAMRLQQQNVFMLSTMEIKALHIWHQKDPQITDDVPWQRQKNTDYVLRKHGPHPSPLNYRTWNYWRHYHCIHSGSVLYNIDESQLYVVNNSQTHCLRLPHAAWLYPLGFSTADIVFVRSNQIDLLANMGDATDPLNECDFGSLISDANMLLDQHVEKWKQKQKSQPDIMPSLISPTTYEVLWQHFIIYDITRSKADMLPGAMLPVIGFFIRMLGRVVYTGKLWAAEYQLLKALVAQFGDAQDNE